MITTSRFFFNHLGIISVSTALLISSADAKPDKGKDHPSSQKADKHAGGKADKKGKKGKPAHADKHASEKKKAKREDVSRRGDFNGRFEERDRDRVVTYFSGYKDKKHGLPPGLARRWENGKRLPPGWRDRVVTGYVIQDDWYPAFEPVPYDWFPGLAVVPDTRLYWYGDRVVRVYEPARRVVDVVVIPTIHIDL